MYRILLCLVCLLAGCAGGMGLSSSSKASHQTGPSGSDSYAFTNGRWFDGQGFQAATWYSVQGRLTRTPPQGRVETVDLSGLFIVPPFGEAHNHNVEGPWNVQAVVERYLKDGVFYVKNPNNVRDFALQIRSVVNQPTSIDAIFAHAGLTGRGGHPIALYEDVLRVSRYEPVIGTVERGWFENRSYIVLDTDADVETKWPVITRGRPDFLKVYLVHSEDDGRAADAQPVHHRLGLHPALVPGIVARAHAAGLQVTAHVETAADFRHAVRAGVDELAHVPGWLLQGPEDAERARLTEDGRALGCGTTRAGRHHGGGGTGHAVSRRPSPAWSARRACGPGRMKSHGAGHETGLQCAAGQSSVAAARRGARVIGSDHAETSLAEVMHLRTLHLFDNRTLLKMWCEATPAAIFPGRHIAKFAEGYEASFLALGGNPIEDFEQVRAIRRRFKQGVSLDAASHAGRCLVGSGPEESVIRNVSNRPLRQQP
jgi:hypothetical protein